jgi:hypothetical protein
MKCIWRTSQGSCIKEDGVARRCRPLLCPDGHQVALVLALAFVFIVVVMILSARG